MDMERKPQTVPLLSLTPKALRFRRNSEQVGLTFERSVDRGQTIITYGIAWWLGRV
jgi:hypothetical protein